MKSIRAIEKKLEVMGAVHNGDDAAVLASEALTLTMAERSRLDPIDAALDAFEIGSLALIARDPMAARTVLDRYAPEPNDWLGAVLISAGRAWLRLAAAEPDAAERAVADHKALVMRQKTEEENYLLGSVNPRRAALLVISSYFLSHAVRCVATGDLERASDIAERATRSADLARQTPQAVGGQWLRVAIEVLSRDSRHEPADPTVAPSISGT